MAFDFGGRWGWGLFGDSGSQKKEETTPTEEVAPKPTGGAWDYVDYFEMGGRDPNQVQTWLDSAAFHDFRRQWEATEENQKLAQQQADKYIAESSGARQASADEAKSHRDLGLEKLNTLRGDAQARQDKLEAEGDKTAGKLDAEAQKVRDNSQQAYDEAAGQLETGRQQVFDVWQQVQDYIAGVQQEAEKVYGDAVQGFTDFKKFRDDVLKQGQANADKTITAYADMTAQNVSVALKGLQTQEKDAIAALQEAASRDPTMTPDRLRAQIDQIRRDVAFKRSEIAVNSANQANEFRASLAKDMYNTLTATGGQMAQATASAYGAYVEAGQALDEVLANSSASLSAASGKVMDAISTISNAYGQLGVGKMQAEIEAGKLVESGQKMKGDLYAEGARLVTEIDKTAAQETSNLLQNHNETMAKLDALAMVMRDSEYTAYMDAYSKRVTPLLPYVGMLGGLALSEDQRKIQNVMAGISLFFSGVTTFANAYGTIKEANRPPPDTSDNSWLGGLFGLTGDVTSPAMEHIWDTTGTG